MDEASTPTKVTEPFPIFRIANRYLLFDINVITHIRREHHICGVLIGNIPIAAQQNVFSGIPLELMPEEARLLVDNKRVAFVVDDALAHEQMTRLNESTRGAYMQLVEAKKLASAMASKRQADLRKAAHFEKIERAKQAGLQKQKERQQAAQKLVQSTDQTETTSESLFESTDDARSSIAAKTAISESFTSDAADQRVVPHDYTPTTSYPPLDAKPLGSSQEIPEATSAYYLFAYLHSKGYFMSPGLRFGCQFVAYPGDPLRYHSHFLSVSKAWDEPIDLIDIVGGGRLGTGVKKGYLVGGVETDDADAGLDDCDDQDVRVFCFEWAAM